ncbi:uncharacterized protein DMAD_03222 [Drosophila madeirensis]|uniref:Uncharacterized protein n=1 Tax=Drosophila madeirensis TaxID=30013 RepID=A0AAU9G7T9_DROMD
MTLYGKAPSDAPLSATGSRTECELVEEATWRLTLQTRSKNRRKKQSLTRRHAPDVSDSNKPSYKHELHNVGVGSGLS